MKSLHIENISKKYRGKTVLDDVSMKMEGIYGLLGPNGAGKTTLMKMLATIIEPTEGRISFNNLCWDQKHAVRKKIGYLPQRFSAYAQVRVYECLNHLAILKGLKEKRHRHEQIIDILDKVNLAEQAHDKVRTLSGGMLRRLGIGQALLGDPPILIIDEPTAGLDIDERAKFRQVLQQIRDDRLIVISTHLTEDISALVQKVGILKEGRLLYEGFISDFTHVAEGKIWEMTTNDQELEQINENQILSIQEQDDQQIVRFISQQPVKQAQRIQPNIEDTYLFCVVDFMYKKSLITFEVKLMGGTFYLPFIGFILALGQVFLGKPDEFQELYWTLEFMITPLSSWWIAFLFYEYYEKEMDKLLFSYPVSIFKHGIWRVSVFLFGYLFLFTILLATVSLVGKGSFIVLFVQYIPLTILFAGFTFLVVAVLKNIFAPLIMIIFYITTEYFTKGELFPWYHAMFFNVAPLDLEDVWLKSVINLCLAIIFIILGHIFLVKRRWI